MPVSVTNQANIFLVSVAGGMIAGFIYDLFRIRRKALRGCNTLVYIEDLLYWILVAVLLFILVYYSNDGEIRGYMFIGVFLGAVIYTLTLSRVVIGVSGILIKLFARLLRGLVYIIVLPFRIVIKILSYPLRPLFGFACALFGKIRRIIKNHISEACLYRRIFKNARKKV